MRELLLSTNESDSLRFENLVEYLAEARKADASDEFRAIVMGHLTMWYLGWAREEETDTGLFIGFKLAMVARWSGWSNKAEFARGLLHAGYIRDLHVAYPPELEPGGGFCVYGAIDRSWAVHRSRANRERLVLFLTDRQKRAEWARKFGVRAAAAPAGWLPPDADAAPAPQAAAGGQGAGEGADQGGPRGTPGVTQGNPGGNPGLPPPNPGVPPFTGSTGKKERNEYSIGTGTEGTKEGRKEPTALPATPQLYELVHANRYENPLFAATAMDPDPDYRSFCGWLVRQHRQEAMGVLAEMTETKERFLGYARPALYFQRVMRRATGSGGERRSRPEPERPKGGTPGLGGGVRLTIPHVAQ